MKQIPNILTLGRILLIPVILALFYLPGAWAAWTALGLYALAAITDYLDGYLARRMNVVSAIGKFLDPIADKILVASLLILIVGIGRLPDLWMLAPIVILMREFLVAGMREYLGPHNIQLPVSKLAKWKTAVQMVAIGFLIVGDYGDVIYPWTLETGQWGLAIAAALTIFTGWNYTLEGLKHLKKLS